MVVERGASPEAAGAPLVPMYVIVDHRSVEEEHTVFFCHMDKIGFTLAVHVLNPHRLQFR